MFVESLADPNSFANDARILVADRGLMELWWRLITVVRWQARFFRGLEKLKASLEGNALLPSPSWWEDERKTAYRTPPGGATPKPSTVETDDDATEPASG